MSAYSITDVENWLLRQIRHAVGSNPHPDHWSVLTFYTDLNYDSLDIIEFIMQAEEMFSISINESEVSDEMTMKAFADLIYTSLPSASRIG